MSNGIHDFSAIHAAIKAATKAPPERVAELATFAIANKLYTRDAFGRIVFAEEIAPICPALLSAPRMAPPGASDAVKLALADEMERRLTGAIGKIPRRVEAVPEPTGSPREIAAAYAAQAAAITGNTDADRLRRAALTERALHALGFGSDEDGGVTYAAPPPEDDDPRSRPGYQAAGAYVDGENATHNERLAELEARLNAWGGK